MLIICEFSECRQGFLDPVPGTDLGRHLSDSPMSVGQRCKNCCRCRLVPDPQQAASRPERRSVLDPLVSRSKVDTAGYHGLAARPLGFALDTFRGVFPRVRGVTTRPYCYIWDSLHPPDDVRKVWVFRASLRDDKSLMFKD